jgi:hypothetical protein
MIDCTEAIVRRAVVSAAKLLQEHANRLPIDIMSLAHSVGVSSVDAKHMSADGYLGRDSSGSLVIRYRQGASLVRSRFTIAHEIGHLLLARVQGCDVTDEVFRHQGGSQAEERAANRIAAELLMPAQFVLNYLRSRRATWNVLDEMRRTFMVSTSALVRRVLELPEVTSVFFRIADGKNPCDDSEIQFRCMVAESQTLAFYERPHLIAQRILRDAKRGATSTIRVAGESGPLTVSGTSRFMDGNGRSGEFWFLAWQCGSTADHDSDTVD